MIPEPSLILKDVQRAIDEDVGSGDVTAELLPLTKQIHAEIIAREPLVICGQPWVNCVFNSIDDQITVHWLVKEGAWLSSPGKICSIQGAARSVLTAERTALNFLQTLSATATQTQQYLQKLKTYKTRLLDTRKTIPGLRMAQKYAVSCAGGMNHRKGLYDAFLIKENHIQACGSIHAAIQAAKASQLGLMIEVEVENLDEFQEALSAKPNRILLDNFSIKDLEDAVKMNKISGCELEASGGITLSNVSEVAATGVDYISIGSITKSIQAIDLSLLIRDC